MKLQTFDYISRFQLEISFTKLTLCCNIQPLYWHSDLYQALSIGCFHLSLSVLIPTFHSHTGPILLTLCGDCVFVYIEHVCNK